MIKELLDTRIRPAVQVSAQEYRIRRATFLRQLFGQKAQKGSAIHRENCKGTKTSG